MKQLSTITTGIAHKQCPSSILISNLPSTISKEIFTKLFAVYGQIVSASIHTKYFGIIKYRNQESSDQAIIRMNGFEIGSNKLNIQYLPQDADEFYETETIEGHTKSMIKNDGSQYKYSKEELSLLSARDIASFVVPSGKVYKYVHKEWMKLIIQYKNEAINYIFYCKANDQYHSNQYNYIKIPDYLHQLLQKQEFINYKIYLKDKEDMIDEKVQEQKVKARNLCNKQFAKETNKLRQLLSFVNENWESIVQAQHAYKRVLTLLRVSVNKKYYFTHYPKENVVQQELIFAEQREELIKFIYSYFDSI